MPAGGGPDVTHVAVASHTLPLPHTLPAAGVCVQPVPLPPLLQTSAVQLLPSLHVVPLSTCPQPVPVLQVSVLQATPSSQALLTGTWLQPVPVLHASVVQATPSSQALLVGVCTQPVLASQVSVVQGKASLHESVAPTQVPLWHVSPVVHALPSSQLLMTE